LILVPTCRGGKVDYLKSGPQARPDGNSAQSATPAAQHASLLRSYTIALSVT